MPGPISVPRRLAMTLGLTVIAASGLARRAAAKPRKPDQAHHTIEAAALGLTPHPHRDQTRKLQAALVWAAQQRTILALPAGAFVCRGLVLPEGCDLIGVAGATRIVLQGTNAAITASNIDRLRLRDLSLVGAAGDPSDDKDQSRSGSAALVHLVEVASVELTGVEVRDAPRHGISLERCGGRLSACTLENIGDAAVFANNCNSLTVSSCKIDECANNGVLVWQSENRHDGAAIRDNQITNIRADAGGSGQNGNGINVYRADNVQISGNRITSVAYSAVRGNASSNIQVAGNHIRDCGEVAIYAEFGFEGAVINANVIDGAATGIVATNFNVGGRLSTITGNLVRNLVRREHEPVDKRGDGIFVEADATVSGNTIEAAATTGLHIGWGRFRRDVVATGNVICACGIGIAIDGPEPAGRVNVCANLIARSSRTAICRTMVGTIQADMSRRDGTQNAPNDRIQVSNNVIS